jgi:hypothetical protein
VFRALKWLNSSTEGILHCRMRVQTKCVIIALLMTELRRRLHHECYGDSCLTAPRMFEIAVSASWQMAISSDLVRRDNHGGNKWRNLRLSDTSFYTKGLVVSCSERSRNSICALKAESTISKFQERDHAHDRRNSSSLRHGI